MINKFLFIKVVDIYFDFSIINLNLPHYYFFKEKLNFNHRIMILMLLF